MHKPGSPPLVLSPAALWGLYSDSWHQGAWGLRALGLSSLSMWQPDAGMGITNMGQKLRKSQANWVNFGLCGPAAKQLSASSESLKPHVDEAQGTHFDLWHILEIQQLIICPLLTSFLVKTKR